jgi:cold shock CspA family protein
MQGTVSQVVPEQGFGFITGADGAVFFFHRSALHATELAELAAGVRVEFEAEQHAKGDMPTEHPRAVGVHLAPGAIPAEDNETLPPEKTGAA